MLKVMSTTFVLMFASLLGVKILIHNWGETTSLQRHSLVVMLISILLGRKIVNKISSPVVCALSVSEGFFYFIARSNVFNTRLKELNFECFLYLKK